MRWDDNKVTEKKDFSPPNANFRISIAELRKNIQLVERVKGNSAGKLSGTMKIAIDEDNDVFLSKVVVYCGEMFEQPFSRIVILNLSDTQFKEEFGKSFAIISRKAKSLAEEKQRIEKGLPPSLKDVPKTRLEAVLGHKNEKTIKDPKEEDFFEISRSKGESWKSH